MVSRENKKAAIMFKKLQLLRSLTNSHAYMKELEQKVERMNQDMISAAQVSSTTGEKSTPHVLKVETKEKSFAVKVFTDHSCRGLLVFILEAFEELGLVVLHARVCCSDTFLLEAVGEICKGDDDEHVDAQKIEQALLQAIQSWSDKMK